MAIKSILVPLDGRDRSQEALATALVVARRFGAHISTLHVSESTLKSTGFATLSSSLRESVLAEEKHLLNQSAQEISNAVEAFARRRKLTLANEPSAKNGITISFDHEYGEVNDTLVRWARHHDTVAISRPGKSSDSFRIGAMGSTVEALLMQSGKPVLLVPPQWKAKKARHAIIAWNDSLEASKALSMTLPWLEQMQKVTIVVARRRKLGGEKVRQQLAWHGIKAEVEILNRRSQSAGTRLLNICKKLEGDFLVMGGYSQSRLRQRIFGGVTDHMLAHSGIITVMVH
jgi:nucleotide-binding universal stress UspA family protein